VPVLVANAVMRRPSASGERELRTGVGSFLAADHPHPLRPAGQVEQAGELGYPGAVTDLAVGVVGRGPHLVGNPGQDGGGVERQSEPDRVQHPLPAQPLQEPVGAAGGVAANQHRTSRTHPRPVTGQLLQRVPGGRDVVGDGVGAGVARPEHDLQRLTSAGLAVIEERTQRVEAIAALVGGPGRFLVAVGGDQRRIEVDDHRTAGVSAMIGGVFPGQLPHGGEHALGRHQVRPAPSVGQWPAP
jgi:hypothetical protein